MNLFFVISGFLITGILQDSRSSPRYFQRFYTRRALRILPAYLVTLSLLWGFHLVRLPYLGICVLFLANMPGLLLPTGTALYGPLWSLAVEEQFYLVWPWLNRWIGRLGMLGTCVLLMLTCPLLRWLAAVHVLHTGEPGSKTWMIADNLAIGAVLALLARTPRVTRKQFAAIGSMFLVIGAVGIMWILRTGRIYEPLGRSVGLSCFMFFGAGMVTCAVCWYRVRRVPKVFSFLLFLGHISYGLYLIHMFCLALYDRVFGIAWQYDFKKLLLRFLVAYSIAIGLAWLSRETYEEWFLRRGRRVPAGEVRARSAAFTT